MSTRKMFSRSPVADWIAAWSSIQPAANWVIANCLPVTKPLPSVPVGAILPKHVGYDQPIGDRLYDNKPISVVGDVANANNQQDNGND